MGVVAGDAGRAHDDRCRIADTAVDEGAGRLGHRRIGPPALPEGLERPALEGVQFVRRAANRPTLRATAAAWAGRDPGRCKSEEHTSELQSLMRISYAVFCLTKTKLQLHLLLS